LRRGGPASSSEQELWYSQRLFWGLIWARLAIFTALTLSNLFIGIWKGGLDEKPSLVLYALVAVVYLGSLLTWLREPRSMPGKYLHLQLQIVIDILLGSVLVFLTGGIESPFCFFLALPVIVTAVFFSRGRTLLTALLASLALAALFVLESQGILRPLTGRLAQPPPARVAYLISLNSVVYFVVAALAGTLGEQLRRTGTSLQRARMDLESLRALHGDIVQSLLSGLMVIDRQGLVTLINPVAAEILQVDPDQAVGRKAEEVFPELAKLASWSERQQVLKTEIMHRTSEREIPLGLTLSPFRSRGLEGGTLVHMQDLSERRRLEASIKQAEKMAALGQMAASMAHEIRNPLASLSGAVQMMRLEQSDPAGRKLMDIVLREARRLDRLLGDFLSFAQPRQPRRERFSLDELVKETLALYAGGLPANVKLVSDIEPLAVSADIDQIRQVLWNILSNAVEAMPAGGKITVRVRGGSEGQEALLQVIDGAPPIPEEIREHIFEPFFTTKENGTGLGLAIVERIVHAHGGEIELERLSAGNCFTVRLPREKNERDIDSR
jgi:two-component system sensor histidine kinase PilS (NtrC family)